MATPLAALRALLPRALLSRGSLAAAPPVAGSTLSGGGSLWSSRPLSADSGATAQAPDTIAVTFIDRDGEHITVRAPVGQNLLEVAHAHDVDLEGACEGSLACSTCHVIVESPEFYARLKEPSDDENDMLDLAFGLTRTSRLGCQVIADKSLDGIVVRLPAATRNFAVDKPKP